MTTNELGTNGGSDTSSSLSQSPTNMHARTGREKQRYDEHEQRLVAGYVTRALESSSLHPESIPNSFGV